MKLPKLPDAGTARFLMAVMGVGLAGYGCWLIYRPAGFIAVGVTLFAIAVVGGIRAGR